MAILRGNTCSTCARWYAPCKRKARSVVAFSPAEGASVRGTPGEGVARSGVAVGVTGADNARSENTEECQKRTTIVLPENEGRNIRDLLHPKWE